MMTPEEFARRMREIEDENKGDWEAAHCHATNLVCDLLRSLGYGDGANIFDRMPS
ncbi:MAG TPA: hypothetical protein VIR45_13970 [Kiloniellaceae bacterium]